MSKYNEFSFVDVSMKVQELAKLLIECRDALPAITLSSAKLHGIKLDLADRIEEALKPWEVPYEPFDKQSGTMCPPDPELVDRIIEKYGLPEGMGRMKEFLCFSGGCLLFVALVLTLAYWIVSMLWWIVR